MSSFSTIINQDLKNILSAYSIDPIIEFRILEGGSENTNLLLESVDKKYVLTICEQKSIEETKILGDLLIYLNQNDFTTSKVLMTIENHSYSVWEEKPILLKEFLPGTIGKNPSQKIITQIVDELIKLHRIKAPDYLPQQFSYGIQAFDEMIALAPESQFCKWLMSIKQYLLPFLDSSLPKSLIHGDIYFSNVIINPSSESVTIMDFEEACYYYRVFDIGMLIIGTCCDGLTPDHSKINTLIATYIKGINLTPLEIKSIKAFTVYAASATAFWRYRKFNHLNPIPELFDHYKDLQKLAEDFLNLSELTFKNL